MSRQSFTDPVTGDTLHAVDDLETDVPEARLYFGRKLGYTEEEIRSMWLRDSRRRRYIDVTHLDRLMTPGEAAWVEARER